MSAFSELRLAAGYETVTALALKSGIARKTLFSWERGHRPPWRYMTQLAEILNTDTKELAKLIWQDIPEDLCSCGCGGKKVFPTDFPQARHLAVERMCGRCGDKHVYETNKDHRSFCQSCARIRDRIVLVCVGFRDPLWKKDAAIRHSAKCVGKLEMLETALRSYNERAKQAEANPSHWGNQRDQEWRPGRYGQIKWARAFRDGKTKTFRCEACARSSFSTVLNEQKLKTFLQERKIRYGRIESRDERRELISTFLPQINPNFVAKKTKWLGGRKPGQKNKGPAFWKNVFFRIGRCVFCRKLTFSRAKNAPTRCHQICYSSWLEKQVKWLTPPKNLGAGQPVAEDSLRKYLNWAEDHYFRKKSYREIAQRDRVHFTLVQQKIDFIMASLPDPAILEKRYGRRVSALIAAAASPISRPVKSNAIF